jgi:hypothetical protein
LAVFRVRVVAALSTSIPSSPLRLAVLRSSSVAVAFPSTRMPSLSSLLTRAERAEDQPAPSP